MWLSQSVKKLVSEQSTTCVVTANTAVQYLKEGIPETTLVCIHSLEDCT